MPNFTAHPPRFQKIKNRAKVTYRVTLYISVIPFFCEQKTPFSHRLSKVTRYVIFARFFIFTIFF